MDKKSPLVSVCVITYQHVNFIRECLDSILMQKTDFSFEICLGEDESTDGTREICKEYAEKYPDKIKLFLRSRKDVIYISGNPTGRYNFTETLKACNGNYIALCEGDDYWTNPLKLQKQVDFLEANPDYSICFTEVGTNLNGKIDETEHSIYYKDILLNKETFETVDLIKNNFIATCSALFRNNNIRFPDWYYQLPLGDWPLHILNSEYGKIKYFPEITAHYRCHDNGNWTGATLLYRENAIFKFYFILLEHYKEQYFNEISQRIKDIFFSIANEVENSKNDLENFKNELENSKNELEQIYSSKKYRFVCKFSIIINKIAPNNSTRRLLLKKIYKIIKVSYSIFFNYSKLFSGKIKKLNSKYAVVKVNNDRIINSNPFVSVIILSFNYGKFLLEAIESLNAQTFQNFEILIIDGGSTDNTRDVIISLAKENSKIKYHFQTNKTTPGEDRQTGLDLAKGKYILFLDADDKIHSTYIEKAVFIFETMGVDYVSGWVQCFGGKNHNGIDIWKTCGLPVYDILQNNTTSNTSLIRKSFIIDNNIEYYKPKSYFEDWDFAIKLAIHGARYYVIEEVMHFYRQHNLSISSEAIRSENWKKSTKIIRNRFSNYSQNKNIIKSIQNKQNHPIEIINPFINFRNFKSNDNRPAILICMPFLGIGGAEKIILDIARHLDKSYRVVLIVTSKTNESIGDFTSRFNELTNEVYHLNNFIPENKFYSFICFLIMTKNINILFQIGSPFIYNILRNLKKDFPAVKIIDQLFNEVGHIASNRENASLINYNILANNVIYNLLKNKFNEIDSKMGIIIHGVDTKNEFNPSSFSFTEKNFFSKGKLNICYLGRHSIEKGTKYFVEIVHYIKQYYPEYFVNMSFLMTGDGPENAKIKKLISRYSLSKYVKLLGFVNDNKNILHHADVIVIPSILDGLPILILEALSMGKLVIASRVGGIPNVIENNKNGFLCKSGEIEDFVKRIIILYENAQLRDEISLNAREYAIKNLDINRMLNEYKNIFDKFLK